MKEYGYLNHSSTSQRDEEAIASMFAVLPCDSVIIEQLWSPGEKHRPAFDALMEKLLPDDILYVHSIDRLGTNTKEAVSVWKYITETKEANIVVLNDDRLNSCLNRSLSTKQVRTIAKETFATFPNKTNRDEEYYHAFHLVDSDSSVK